MVDFGRYVKSLGFAKGIGLHAFRHALANEPNVSDVPEKEIALVRSRQGGVGTESVVSEALSVYRPAPLAYRVHTIRLRSAVSSSKRHL